MAASDTTATLGNPEHAAVYAARSVLGEHRSHPLIAPILARLDLLADPVTGSPEPDEAASLAKMGVVVEDLMKSEHLTRTQAIEKARRDHPELARAVAAGTRRVPLTDAAGWGRERPKDGVTGGGTAGPLERFRAAVAEEMARNPQLTRSRAMEIVGHRDPQLQREALAA